MEVEGEEWTEGGVHEVELVGVAVAGRVRTLLLLLRRVARVHTMREQRRSVRERRKEGGVVESSRKEEGPRRWTSSRRWVETGKKSARGSFD